VLIGGQAVQYWTKRYKERVPEIRENSPYATKDLDFCGTAAQARECARLLGGAPCKEFTPDHRSPCAAIIELDDLQIDFLRVPYGIPDANALRAQSLSYEFGRVMHPMHMLESRVANVAELPQQYQNERGLQQLRGAILCMHELLEDTLNERERDPRAARVALKLSERVFHLAQSDAGVRVHVANGVELLDAVVVDERLPEAFRTHRLPQATAQVEAKRLQMRRSFNDEASLSETSLEPSKQRRGRRH
jgi:uncharacterized protein (UPF0147 family)